MLRKIQYKLLLIKEVIDFDIMDYLYINTALKYTKDIIIRIMNVFEI